jgi:hypothetical protein
MVVQACNPSYSGDRFETSGLRPVQVKVIKTLSQKQTGRAGEVAQMVERLPQKQTG